MKFKPVVILLLLLTACGTVEQAARPPSVATTVAPPSTQQIFTQIPSFTPAPELTATPLFQLHDNGRAVVYDFTAHLCEAEWMNGSQRGLPCPGDINNPGGGYVGLLSGSDQELDQDFPLILMNPNTGALFGRYPKFQVGLNDEFRASLACRANSNCDVEFTLAYYDANGKYQENFPKMTYRQGEPPINLVLPLSGLAGQSVEFVLVVRPTFQSDPLAAWALWISPRILR